MELVLYWKIVRKRLWLIVLLAVVAAASAFYFGSLQVPLYRATTTLFLNPAAPSALLPYEEGGSIWSLANTYIEFMRTRSFASLIAQELDPPLAEEDILGALSTELVQNTQFFRISATHPDPAVAQALANTAAQVLIAENQARTQAQRLQIEAQQDPARTLEQQRLTELQTALEEELAYYSDRITALQAQITALEGQPPSKEVDQAILNQREELVRYQTLRSEIFGSLAQTQATLATFSEDAPLVPVDTAVVVDPARLPEVPQSRNLLQYTLLAAAVGMGLGVGLAFLLEYLDYTIKTPEELDAVYGMSTLGVIGRVRNSSRDKASKDQLITLTHSRSPVAEAYRALRTNLRYANPDRPLHSLLVTSAVPLEGKSLTSANLAIVLAQSGRSVLLVDADLRRPRLHRLFAVDRKIGLTDLVADQQQDLAAYLQPTQVDNLRLLPCGPLPRNPAELLSSDRAAEVMELLAANADIVIYDTPPAGTVTDAALLGSRVDGVLHVVQAGGPRRDLVQRVKGILTKAGATVLGPVLNQVEPGDLGYYSYYYYGYSHNGRDRTGERGLRRLLRRQRGNPEQESPED